MHRVMMMEIGKQVIHQYLYSDINSKKMQVGQRISLIDYQII